VRPSDTQLAIVALLIAGIGALPATPAPRDMVGDYFANGQWDYTYSTEDLQGALAITRRQQRAAPRCSAFADSVNETISNALRGSGEAAQQQLKTQRRGSLARHPPAS
jgi:hypothetical protein